MRICLLLLLFSTTACAQELFPLFEAASSVPKNVLGVRLHGNTYEELNEFRSMGALKLMYGLSGNVSVSLTGSMSNHHDKKLPANLITHTHEGTQTIYQTNEFQRGLNYPYRINGGMLNIKYRFLSLDEKNKHFRMAVYGEGSYIESAHDEAEPTLMDDTKGIGAGIIATYLNHHTAVSFSGGKIVPGSYSEVAPDPAGGDLHTKITYGKAITYNLSLGYLLFPFKYKSYSDVNINIYTEFMGKSYKAAEIIQNDVNVVPETNLLKAGSYIDVYPGIQAIIKSNLRIDFSVGLPLAGKSYTKFYPVYTFGIQRYFFL